MLDAYTFVEGPSLSALTFEVRERFLKRPPYELDDGRTPNSLQLVAIDVFERQTAQQQAAVLRDLIAGNRELFLLRSVEEVFETANTPAAILTDLVCEVICQILRRDCSLRTQDDWRTLVAAESAGEADQRRKRDALPPCDR
jgi:hypothetical protein